MKCLYILVRCKRITWMYKERKKLLAEKVPVAGEWWQEKLMTSLS